jgi:MoxR-like ATPase
MLRQVFRVDKPKEYQKAGPTDLIKLLPVPGGNPLFLPKSQVEILVYGIVSHEMTHLSGPTGSAKTSLIEAMQAVPENFRGICQSLGFSEKPLRVFPIEMATYEAPGELYQRRALKNGTTFDEESGLVRALTEAAKSNGQLYNLIWLREIGRVHSATVQGGLLDLMSREDIILPSGNRIDGRGIAWVADSNYQVETDATHTLVTFDDALRRRFTVNLTLDYLPAEQEMQVFQHLIAEGQFKKVEDDLIAKVVMLGQVIRRHRSEGNLLSVPPPTIYGYLALVRMAQALPHLSIQQVALATLLGNASPEDRKHVSAVFNEVFGLQAGEDDDPTKGGGLF